MVSGDDLIDDLLGECGANLATALELPRLSFWDDSVDEVMQEEIPLWRFGVDFEDSGDLGPK